MVGNGAGRAHARWPRAACSRRAEAGAFEELAHVLVVARANGTDRALARGGTGGGGQRGAAVPSDVPRVRSTPCQQAKTNRPPGTRARRIAAKAAVGSSKNITPNWRRRDRRALSPSEPVCTSSLDEAAAAAPARLGPARAKLEERSDRSTPTTSPRARRHRRARWSARRRRSRCRGFADPGRRVDRLHEVGRHRLGQAFRLRPRRHPPLVIPALGLCFVGHGARYPAALASAPCTSASSSFPPTAGARPGANGDGRTRRVLHRWTYDHIRWGGMPDGPWHAAVPVLAAAASGDLPVRLGTLVATPNFRHPVTLARDALALDDISGGPVRPRPRPGQRRVRRQRARPGAVGPAQRLARFAQFLEVLAPIVEGDAAARHTMRTEHYAAAEAPSTPGAVQRPLPLTVAAGGAEGMDLVAALRSAVGDHRPDRSGRAHARDDPARGAHPAPCVEAACTAVGRATRRPSARSSCGCRPNRSIDSADNSRSWPRPTPNSASTRSCSTTRTRRGPSVAMSRLRGDRGPPRR